MSVVVHQIIKNSQIHLPFTANRYKLNVSIGYKTTADLIFSWKKY